MSAERLMELEKARDSLLSHILPLKETETAELSDAFGRVCAEDVYSKADAPSFPRSAMDGYAVYSGDIAGASQNSPVTLTVVCEMLAGDHTDIQYAPETAVRVMTGGFIPEGYDCVVKQEDTDYGEKCVRIYKAVSPFTNYSGAGEEFSKGDLLVKKGSIIGRIDGYLLASGGVGSVSVYRRPRIAIITTGSELQEPCTPLQKGHIYNGLSYLLSAAVKEIGAEPVYCIGCKDDEEDIADTIQGISGDVDLVITTGGVSVGKKDLIPAAMKKLGAEVLFHGVDIQPGTPTMAGVYCGGVILSLSGNPFAALANFDYYFPCIMEKLTGCKSYGTVVKKAVMGAGYPKENVRRRLVRAWYEDGRVYPAVKHFASVVGNLRECNCYMDVPPRSPLHVGDSVNIRMMR
ncbi:MAG: molybdopterin molybdotransferase MoeA [Oscillospiraceae bacterium]|nr:molybdopterin molybdotransferase MoeA [Oscillospiraceae bacterium]